MSAWNDFVKKIYHEGHNLDSRYSFKQALKDASKRKSEMESMVMGKSKKMKKSHKSKSKLGKKSRKTRRRKH